MMSESEAFDMLDHALSAAAGDESDALLISGRRQLSRFAESTLHQNIDDESTSLTVRVILPGGRIGVAQTSSLTAEGVDETVRMARRAASFNDPSPGYRGLYHGQDALPALPVYDEETATHSPRKTAVALSRIFQQGTTAGVTYAGSVSVGRLAVAAGNSHGVRRYVQTTQGDSAWIAMAGGHSGYSAAVSRRIGTLDLPALAEEATRRARWMSQRSEATLQGVCEVILEAPAIAEVLEWMNMIAFSGQSHDEESSFMTGRRGQSLASPLFSLSDDPIDPEFLPFPFDMEGIPKRRVSIFEAGTAAGPLVDKVYADRLGVDPTASATGLGSEEHGSGLHLSVKAGASSMQDLIETSERAVLVTRFHYVNGLLDPATALMTGMTRDGTFLIEGGRVVARLPNLRWTQSMTEAIGEVVGLTATRRAVGSFWNPIGGTLSPAIKFRRWNFTG